MFHYQGQRKSGEDVQQRDDEGGRRRAKGGGRIRVRERERGSAQRREGRRKSEFVGAVRQQRVNKTGECTDAVPDRVSGGKSSHIGGIAHGVRILAQVLQV